MILVFEVGSIDFNFSLNYASEPCMKEQLLIV